MLGMVAWLQVDLGGWLSQQGILGQLVGGWKRPWLDPMILSVVALRDKVIVAPISSGTAYNTDLAFMHQASTSLAYPPQCRTM